MTDPSPSILPLDPAPAVLIRQAYSCCYLPVEAEYQSWWSG